MQQPHIVRRRAEAGGMTGRSFSNGRHHKARAASKELRASPPSNGSHRAWKPPCPLGGKKSWWRKHTCAPKKRRFLGAHRHGEEEEEGRALGEPYAHFVFDPPFFLKNKNMTVKLNYSAHTHTHTHTRSYEQHSKQTSIGGKRGENGFFSKKKYKSHEFDPSIIK